MNVEPGGLRDLKGADAPLQRWVFTYGCALSPVHTTHSCGDLYSQRV